MGYLIDFRKNVMERGILYGNFSELLPKILGGEVRGYTRRDCFSKDLKKRGKHKYDLFWKEVSNKSNIQDHLTNAIKNNMSEKKYIQMVEAMKQSLVSNEEEGREEKVSRRKLINLFDAVMVENTFGVISTKSLVEIMYYFYYFIFIRSLPSICFFDEHSEIRKDLAEFENQVLLKHGVSGNPGQEAIQSLAEKGNVFALYEMAEMAYYGNGKYYTIDYVEAYYYYTLFIEKNKMHPLALWSLGHILYLYKYPKRELRNAVIPELDKMSNIDRIMKALSFFLRTVALEDERISTQGAAYNSLGMFFLRIARNDEITRDILKNREDIDEYEFMENVKKALHSSGYFLEKLNSNVSFRKIAQQYFDKAIENGNKFAYNNMAKERLDNIFNNELSEKATGKIASEAIQYLEKSALQNESWACNLLGQIYFHGKEFFEKSKNYEKIDLQINRKLAFSYYFKAHTQNGAGYEWGTYNLITKFLLEKKFSAYIKCSDIRRIHMDQPEKWNEKLSAIILKTSDPKLRVNCKETIAIINKKYP